MLGVVSRQEFLNNPIVISLEVIIQTQFQDVALDNCLCFGD